MDTALCYVHLLFVILYYILHPITPKILPILNFLQSLSPEQ